MLQILFAATSEIAVPTLEELYQQGRVKAVLTAPDAAQGRSKSLQASPVKQAALALGIEIIQPAKLDVNARQAVKSLGVDLLVCMAYGKLFGPLFLELFSQGGINIHPSLLPRWRGPSPINAAILAGDKLSGITVQRLALAMDAGDILKQQEFVLDETMTAKNLSNYCAKLSAKLTVEVLRELESGREEVRSQDSSEATYCHLIKKDDGIVDWKQSAETIDRMVRAYHVWPRAQTWWNSEVLYLEESCLLTREQTTEVFTRSQFAQGELLPGCVIAVDKRLGLLVQTGNGLLGLRRLQLQSKKSMDHLAFVNGARGFLGSVLGHASSSQ